MRREHQIAILSGAFLVGLRLGFSGLAVSSWAVASLVVACLLLRHQRLVPLLLIALAITVGVWRGQAIRQLYHPLTGLVGQKVELTGIISDDPGRSAGGLVQFGLADVHMGNRPLAGLVKVSAVGAAPVQRGYRVRVSAKLRPALGSAQSDASFAQLQILSTHQNGLELARQRFFVGIRNVLPEPLASFGLALLIGSRSSLPSSFQQMLADVGLSHLIAVSGYNLTILVGFATMLLKRSSRFTRTTAGFWLIGLFLAVSGFSPSLVRAAWVSGLALLAAYYGRIVKPVALIALAAGITAGVRPEYLADVGWQLSFLAFYGILILAPYWAKLWGSGPVRLMLLESLAAQAMTLPLIMLVFGRLSWVSPLANLLVLPVVPAAMVVSLIAGLAGLAPSLALAAWPARYLLETITGLVQALAGVPAAAQTVRVAWGWVAGWYAIILAGLLLARRQGSRRAPASAIIEG